MKPEVQKLSWQNSACILLSLDHGTNVPHVDRKAIT